MMLWYLRVLVFWSGLVVLGVELAASRLLAPYFGTSLIVWSCLIGLILVSLAGGYWLGGVWADRSPRIETLLGIGLVGGLATALVPVLARPVLSFALDGFAEIRFGLLVGSFAAAVALLCLPVTLLGCVTPFAVRLATQRVENTGRRTGQLFACSTVGSFIGAFLPVMVLIPAWGTRLTYVFFGVSMLLVVLLGFGVNRAWKGFGLAAVLAVGVVALAPHVERGRLKPGERVIYETESRYHYIRVLEDAQGWRSLELNEGVVTHSKYHPQVYFTGGEWDYFAVAPFFNPAPYDPLTRSKRWALMGVGAGTTARLVTRTYGAVAIDGVEIDRDIVRVGRTYFGMNMTNLAVHVQDGRRWLALNEKTYDVIGIDAYRQPYIPFELATREFFALVDERLSPRGVAAINVGRTPDDLRLVHALATTMAEVFPQLFFIHLPHERNTVIVATRTTSTVADFRANARSVVDPVLRLVLERTLNLVDTRYRGTLVLTDDRAPVERLMDVLVLKEALRYRRLRPGS